MTDDAVTAQLARQAQQLDDLEQAVTDLRTAPPPAAQPATVPLRWATLAEFVRGVGPLGLQGPVRPLGLAVSPGVAGLGEPPLHLGPTLGMTRCAAGRRPPRPVRSRAQTAFSPRDGNSRPAQQ